MAFLVFGTLLLMLVFVPTASAASNQQFQLQVLEDKAQQYDLPKVIQLLQDGQFDPLDSQALTVGYTKAVFWLWIVPHGGLDSAQKHYLNLAYPMLQNAELYQVAMDANAPPRVEKMGVVGSTVPASLRPVISTSHYFPLSEPGKAFSGYLVRIQSQTSLSVPIQLLDDDEFNAQQRSSHLWYGFIIGTIFLLLIYNLFVSWWMQESANAIYLVFLSALLFVFLSVTGIAHTYISAKLGGPLLWLIPLSLHLISLSGYVFASKYFAGTAIPKLWMRCLVWGAWGSIVLLPTVWLDYQTAMMIAMFDAVMMVIVLFGLASIALYHKTPGAPLFFIGRLFVLCGGLIQFAKTLGWFPATGLTEYVLFVGVILEAIVLSGGLAIKTKALEQQQASTRAELLATQQQSLQELTLLNQALAAENQEKNRSESIQKALFTINELSAGDEDMQTFLLHVHQTVGALMFARNFYVALYHQSQQCVQFAYFADEKDQDLPQPTELIPVQRLEGSWTMWVIEHGEMLFGSSEEITKRTGLAATFGSIARCWFGIPLLHAQGVLGVLVVQIYDDQPPYSLQERQLLNFVSQHISNALQRKQYRNQLELQVQERTQELSENLETLQGLYKQLNQIHQENQIHLSQVQTLLDNTGQGFLSCDADFNIQPSYSKECLHIFQTTHLQGSVVDLLAHGQPAAFYDLCNEVLGEVMQPDQPAGMVTTYLSLLPSELYIFDRLYQIEYKRLAVGTLMFILSDITEKTKLAKALQEQQEQAQFIVYALNHPGETQQILQSFESYLQQLSQQAALVPSVAELTELYRQVHTFKSLTAQIHCPGLPKQLHALEEQLQNCLESPELSQKIDSLLQLERLEQQLQAAKHLVQQQLPLQRFTEDVHLPQALHQQIVQFLESQGSDLAQPLRMIQFRTFHALLKPHVEMAQQLAHSQGKQLAAFEFQGLNLRVDPEYYRNFFQVLVHLFRNAVDHGIEQPELRAELGKPIAAHLRFTAAVQADQLCLTLSDDGRGIDLDAVLQKALKLQLISADLTLTDSPDQIAQLIFSDALSTAQDVSMISGRGLGLAAVKQQLAAYAADIRVYSVQGQGCEFRIVMPLLAEHMDLSVVPSKALQQNEA